MDLKNKFELTKPEFKAYQNMLPERKEEIFNQLSEIYHALGKELVEDYVFRYWEETCLMVDNVNPGTVSADILENPFRIHIFLRQVPEHLSFFLTTRFNRTSYTNIRRRWIVLMNIAFEELWRKGLTPFEDKAIAIYRFHFTKVMDTDNYSVRTLNNCLRDVGLIKDDNLEYLATYMDGIIDPKNPGVEITILKKQGILKYITSSYIQTN